MYGVTSEGLRSLRISFIVLTAQRLLLVTILTGGVTLCVGALTQAFSLSFRKNHLAHVGFYQFMEV